MASSCTIWGLSATEIFRSLCKTQVVTETSMMPKMILIYPCTFSTVLRTTTTLFTLHSQHNPQYQSNPGRVSGPKGKMWDEYLTCSFFFDFLLSLGKNSAGAKQHSSWSAHLPVWEGTGQKVDMRAYRPSSCHHPKGDWLQPQGWMCSYVCICTCN